MVAFSLFAGIAFFVDIAHWVLDHLLWNHVYHVFESSFQFIDNWRLLFAQVNHGVKPEELKEVGTVWESLNLGFAADDKVRKLCIEDSSMKNALISAVVWLVAPPYIYQKTY